MNSQTGPPDLTAVELEEVGVEPGPEEFFSRNFLLILTALNLFGWGTGV
jgi:hypothetical protein